MKQWLHNMSFPFWKVMTVRLTVRFVIIRDILIWKEANTVELSLQYRSC